MKLQIFFFKVTDIDTLGRLDGFSAIDLYSLTDEKVKASTEKGSLVSHVLMSDMDKSGPDNSVIVSILEYSIISVPKQSSRINHESG